jgi:hypothetical protein
MIDDRAQQRKNRRLRYLQKHFEITPTYSIKEGINNLSLPAEINIGSQLSSPHFATSATRELPCRNRSAPDDGRNVVECTANMSCRTNASRSCGAKAQGADQEDDRHPKGSVRRTW